MRHRRNGGAKADRSDMVDLDKMFMLIICLDVAVKLKFIMFNSDDIDQTSPLVCARTDAQDTYKTTTGKSA